MWNHLKTLSFILVIFLMIPYTVFAGSQTGNDVGEDADLNLEDMSEEELQYVPEAQRNGEGFDDSYLHSDEDAADIAQPNQTYPNVNKYIQNMQVPDIEFNHISFLPVFPYRNGYGSVEGVVAHETANDSSTIDGEISWMKRNYKNAFVHAFVDHERIIETHPLDNAAWGAGPVANQRFVHVELVRVHSFDDFARSINNYADYIAGILYDYDLKIDSAEKDGKGTLWSHKAVSKYLGGTTHVDPHGYFKKYGYHWNDFVKLVKKKYKQKEGLTRLRGKDRYRTAVSVSKEGWKKSDTVIVARGDEYADALAGVPLAKKYNAPLLLTQPNKFNAATKKEIARLGAKKAYFLGDKKAISKKIEKELKGMGVKVERVAGSDRTETAYRIAQKLTNGATSKQAVLVNGYDFPGALSVASYAAREGMPILLTQDNRLPKATKKAFNELNVSKTTVIGGKKVVSSKIASSVPKAKRVSGSDRFGTAVA
ncbi:MAG TPA: cell wall-binding repeat-containing protein, partial [Bacillota bacterium]|nr:cell wall-binding repeat-containing protein [Bacillota bacterium]